MPSIGGLPSVGPAPSIHTASGQQQHFVPMGAAMHDRTPSFGSGIGSSISAGPPKRGSAALVTVAVVALVGAGLIGVALSRMSAKRAAAASDGDATAAPAGTTFAVDVQTTPDTAVFELDGISVGSARLERRFARDGQKHVLRVSAPGYETLLVSFDETHPPPSIIGLHASPGGAASSALAGKGPAIPPNVAPKPTTVVAPGPAAGARPAPGPNVKPKPDRPRTDNIDPWE
jgi:hypothetical protein